MQESKKQFNQSSYDFSMEEYKHNISIKYDVINNRALLSTEIASTAAEGLAPNLASDGAWYQTFLFEENGPVYYEDVVLKACDERFNTAPLDTEALIVMPVSGLGDASHIYSTMEKYSKQAQLVSRKTPLLLWVNAIETQMDSVLNQELFQRTTDEIARAKQDFSELNIIDMYYFVPEKEVKNSLNRGGPWGLIMKRVYDVAAVAAYKLTQRPGSKSEDIAIIRNDSDVIDLDEKYFDKWFDSLSSNENTFGMQGASRFGAKDADESRFPGLSVIMNFIPLFDLYTGDRYRFQAANFAIKASAYSQMGGSGRLFFTGIGSCDAMLGERLKAVTRIRDQQLGRTSLDKEIIVSVDASLKTDWSRPLAAYINGHDPRRAWTTWSDSANGISQRKDSLPDINSIARESLNESMTSIILHVSHLLLELDEERSNQLVRSFFGNDNVTYSNRGGLCFTKKGADAYEAFYITNKAYCSEAFRLNDI